MSPAFSAYLLLLGAILAAGLKGRDLRPGRVLVALFLLIWADLILTAQLLSIFAAIDVMGAYIAASLAIAAVISVGLRFVPPGTEPDFPAFPDPFSPAVSRYVAWFLAGTAALAVLADLVMAYGLLPANPDSIAYRFPRAYWYLGHGALTHFSNAADPRALYYPFKRRAALFAADPFSPRAPGVHAAVLAVLADGGADELSLRARFRRSAAGRGGDGLADLSDAERVAAIIVDQRRDHCGLCAAGRALLPAPLVLGAPDARRPPWHHRRRYQRRTKLHAMFYAPLLLAIAVALAVHGRAVSSEIRTWLTGRRLATLAVATGLSAAMALSFIWYNYLSAGRATAWEFNDQLLNRPFDWHVALQTIVLYASQVVLTPLADLHVAFSPAARAQHYDSFNRLVAPLFGGVDNGAAYTSASYRFSGIKFPLGGRLQ